MSRTDDGADPGNALAETFDVCSDCGTPSVRVASHSCSESDADSNDGRDGRVENDPYPDDDPVLVLTSFTQTSYPYHDLDADGDPLCPASRDATATEYTRRQANARGFAPCEFCQRIRQSNERNDRDERQDHAEREDAQAQRSEVMVRE